jgi:2-oxoglutarate ferredoxin oxidoreductase subunit delta
VTSNDKRKAFSGCSPERTLDDVSQKNSGSSKRQEKVTGAVEKRAKKEKKPAIEINRDFCKGCGICVAFCPKEVLELDDHEKAVVKHPEKCNACMLCELRCPDMAIEVRREQQRA